MVRAGSIVTTGNVSEMSATEVETFLEVTAGKGAFSTTFQTAASNLLPAVNGALTSGGAVQFQLSVAQQVTIFMATLYSWEKLRVCIKRNIPRVQK